MKTLLDPGHVTRNVNGGKNVYKEFARMLCYKQKATLFFMATFASCIVGSLL